MPKKAFARKAASLTTKRVKKKGKPPSKREQAQMVAMSEMGMGTYEIGASMQRAPNTVRKYLTSPMFTDEKFQKLVEEYKSKELIDLTVLNIEARARLHDLVPTMTPIEAIALMDKSFGERRLLEGKSTENIFSLRKIISEAHISTEAHITVEVKSGGKENKQEENKSIEEAQIVSEKHL
jgi:hypothetical protein